MADFKEMLKSIYESYDSNPKFHRQDYARLLEAVKNVIEGKGTDRVLAKPDEIKHFTAREVLEAFDVEEDGTFHWAPWKNIPGSADGPVHVEIDVRHSMIRSWNGKKDKTKACFVESKSYIDRIGLSNLVGNPEHDTCPAEQSTERNEMELLP